MQENYGEKFFYGYFLVCYSFCPLFEAMLE
jgi:hypothetical protein